MSSLDIDSAIGAHKAWRSRLENVVYGIEESSLSCDSICDDRKCLLGTWLYGRGQVYASWEHFTPIMDTHKQFHESACNIVKTFNQGHAEEAQALLDGEFSRLSGLLVGLLTLLRIKVNCAPPHRVEPTLDAGQH